MITDNNGYIVGLTGAESDYDRIKALFLLKPKAPSGYTYKLRADNLEWELVELPPIEPEPLTDEEALTRFSNSITGASDQTLVEAAETLITERIKED